MPSLSVYSLSALHKSYSKTGFFWTHSVFIRNVYFEKEQIDKSVLVLSILLFKLLRGITIYHFIYFWKFSNHRFFSEQKYMRVIDYCALVGKCLFWSHWMYESIVYAQNQAHAQNYWDTRTTSDTTTWLLLSLQIYKARIEQTNRKDYSSAQDLFVFLQQDLKKKKVFQITQQKQEKHHFWCHPQ